MKVRHPNTSTRALDGNVSKIEFFGRLLVRCHKNLVLASTVSMVAASTTFAAENEVNKIFENFEALAQPESVPGNRSPASEVAPAPLRSVAPPPKENVEPQKVNAPKRAPASFRPAKRKVRPKPVPTPESPSVDVSPAPVRPNPERTSAVKPESPAVSPDVSTPERVLVIPSDASPSEGPTNFGLTGNWGGLRSRLDGKGIGIALIYKSEPSRVFGGGAEQGGSWLHNLDARLLVDTEKALGWTGGTLFVYGIGDWGSEHGRKPSAAVGDAQGTSNLETVVDRFKLYEAWVQQKFADQKASILLGIHDLNSEFYVTDSSALFRNSSFGVGRELSQSGQMGPSIFPYTTSAIRLRADPTSAFSLQAGLFNSDAGNPDTPRRTQFGVSPSHGLLLIQEASFTGSEQSPHKYGIGTWHYTRTFDHSVKSVTTPEGESIPVQSDSHGFYFLADQSLSSVYSVFGRFGIASIQSNAIRSNLSGGSVAKGLIPGRDEDKVGVSFTRVYSAVSDQSPETAYELTYRIEFGRGFVIQPDFQWIDHPSFSGPVRSATVGALRCEISF